MLKRILYFILFFISGCVERYEFVIRNNEPTLVVEAHISDKSFKEALDYPSDGRYFTVKLNSTSDVTNVRDKPILSAQVQLANDEGELWDYSESAPGVYTLFHDEFKAEEGVRYKLTIKLAGESVVESDWVSLPETLAPPMGEIGFKEEDIQQYIIQAREEVLVTVKGIRTQIAIPENSTGKTLYYRWTFAPLWVYKAPFESMNICWATDPYYMRNYAVLKVNGRGNLNKDLFFMETLRNERIFEKFSALIVEHSMHEDYYNFWKEMQEQNGNGAIFNKPPFNLHTNYHMVTGPGKISGYFGVVREQAKRWYFDKSELSYYVDNTVIRNCLYPIEAPPPECFRCRLYSNGTATNVKPVWWMK